MRVEICKVDKNLYILYWFWFKPFLNSINFFFLYLDTIYRTNEVQESNLILEEAALFQICINVIFFKDFQNRLNNFDVTFPSILGIEKNIIQINDDKIIEFFSQDLINIALKAFRCIS